jgi:hypothetical protein
MRIATADMRQTVSSCKRFASIGLPQGCHLFRVNAARARDFGSEPAFQRNTAERMYIFEAAHNPEVAGSNAAPATRKALETEPFCCLDWCRETDLALGEVDVETEPLYLPCLES